MTRYVPTRRLHVSLALPYVTTDMTIGGDSWCVYAEPCRKELYPCWSNRQARLLRASISISFYPPEPQLGFPEYAPL